MSAGLGRLERGLTVMFFAELGQDAFMGACLASISTVSRLVRGGPSAGRTHRIFDGLREALRVPAMGKRGTTESRGNKIRHKEGRRKHG